VLCVCVRHGLTHRMNISRLYSFCVVLNIRIHYMSIHYKATYEKDLQKKMYQKKNVEYK